MGLHNIKPAARNIVRQVEGRRGEERREEKEGFIELYSNKTEIPSPAAWGTSVGNVHAYVDALTHTYLFKFVGLCKFKMIDATGCFFFFFFLSVAPVQSITG